MAYHLQVGKADIGEYILLPGDPARSPLIAALLEQPRKVGQNREFCVWTGYLDGTAVTVCSTGIGSPSTAIAMEELADLGAHTYIRVGTCGALQPHVRRGDLVVLDAAVRDEGTSLQYISPAFPAVADVDVTRALYETAMGMGARCHVGTTVSVDSFYSEVAPDTVPVGFQMQDRWQAWLGAGAIAAEMECGALYVAAATRKIRAGAICVVVDETYNHDVPEHGAVSLDQLLMAATEGTRALIENDRKVRGMSVPRR